MNKYRNESQTMNAGKILDWKLFPMLFLVVAVDEAMFGPWIPVHSQDYLQPYLCLPLLMWPAFRFGARETATAMFIMSAIII